MVTDTYEDNLFAKTSQPFYYDTMFSTLFITLADIEALATALCPSVWNLTSQASMD